MYRANSAISFESESQMVVSEAEIKKYYEENPILQETVYIVETAFVPFSDTDLNVDIKEELEKYISDEINKPHYLCWDAPVEVKESEITNQNKFLKDLQTSKNVLKRNLSFVDLLFIE